MGRMKEQLFNADVQPEMYRAAARDFQIAESARTLENLIDIIVVDSGLPREALIDDLRTEILYLNDIIGRH